MRGLTFDLRRSAAFLAPDDYVKAATPANAAVRTVFDQVEEAIGSTVADRIYQYLRTDIFGEWRRRRKPGGS